MIHHYGLSTARLQKQVRIVSVGSEGFSTWARRPSYSVLDLRETVHRLDETPAALDELNG